MDKLKFIQDILKRISAGLLSQKHINKLRTTFYKRPPIEINGWSIIHALSGVAAALLLDINTVTFILYHTYWEIFQFISGDNKFDLESLVDITFDTLFGTFGFVVTRLML